MIAALQALANTIAGFAPLVTVGPDECGVRIRRGRIIQKLGPGLYWRWPIVDQIETLTKSEQSINMSSQSLTTIDGVSITTSGRIKYRIVDPALATVEVFDLEDSITEECETLLAAAVMDRQWSELEYGIAQAEVEQSVTESALAWGVEVISFNMTNFVQARTLRLLQE